MAASNAGACVRKPLCNARWRESEGAWDQCAALFITAAVQQLQISVHTEMLNSCPPASLPLFLRFTQEHVLMMLSFITQKDGETL